MYRRGDDYDEVEDDSDDDVGIGIRMNGSCRKYTPIPQDEEELYPVLPGDKDSPDPETALNEARMDLGFTPPKKQSRNILEKTFYRKRKTKPKVNRSYLIKRSLEKCRDYLPDSCECTTQCLKNFFCRIFPFIKIMQGYSLLYDFPSDLVAGLTVGIMHIPQGMAYALLTQLPPVYGLYTSFYPVLTYFLFGTSRHVSVGTFAVISLMVGAVVDKGHVAYQKLELLHVEAMAANLTSDHPMLNTTFLDGKNHLEKLEEIKVSYAMSVTFAVGALQMILGFLRLGFVTTFLSDPLISGFTTGAAVHVFSSQIKSAFGIAVGRYSGPLKLVYAYRDFFSNLHNANFVTMTATIVAICALIAIKEGINNNKSIKSKLKIPIPIELLVIVGGTVISFYLHLNKEFNVEIVGEVPRGLPPLNVEQLRFVPDLIGESFAICFTAFAISFAMAKILADKHNYEVDANQELLAYGISNMIGSMFSSFCCSGSLSRSMVQDNVGGKTQVTSLVSSLLVIIVLVSLGPVFETLPNCILAAIIIVSLKGLFLQFKELRRLWKVSKVDFCVWIVVFLSTVLLDVDLGLLVGLIFNLIPVLLRTQTPYTSLLGNVEGTDVYADISLHKQAKEIPGIKIFRFESALYYGNIQHFRKRLIKDTGLDPKALKQLKQAKAEADMAKQHKEICMATKTAWNDEPCNHSDTDQQPDTEDEREVDPYAIVLDGSTIQYIDSVTVRVLKEIVQEFAAVDVEVFLGECKAAVRGMLDKSGFYKYVPRRQVCATIHHAVRIAQRSHVLTPDQEFHALRKKAVSVDTIGSDYVMAPESSFVNLELLTSNNSSEDDSDDRRKDIS
ncbi:hypothetical protein SNE40_015212 [Patella caerulea]|uniref:STAS domain-containing protein n=1 Tax=Patella caerulea TaxID=87958 RepID=A0AAN8JGI3_PATCE